MVRIIGDVHGKYRRYKKLIRDVPASVAVGDMGIGFYSWPHRIPQQNPPYDTMAKGNHRFVRGNHDNPSHCRTHPFCIRDGTVEGDWFFCGGAKSIDMHLRHEGFDWWADEELNYNEFQTIVDRFIEVKPRIVVSHECPDQIVPILLQGGHHQNDGSITRQAFGVMWDAWKPDLWFFGHWHRSVEMNIQGTVFRCLNELEYVDVDPATLSVTAG